MNWENLCPNLSFSIEKKMGNLHNEMNNEWDIPFPQVSGFYQWVGRNLFSIEKKVILNPFKILRKPQNFWP